jgi:hypothetical protein
VHGAEAVVWGMVERSTTERRWRLTIRMLGGRYCRCVIVRCTNVGYCVTSLDGSGGMIRV